MRFLFLSHEISQIKEIVCKSRLPPDLAVLRSVKAKDVPRFLSASDCGVVFRSDVDVNNVASPIKISEYLVNGLKVVASDCIGDASDLIEQHRLGMVFGGNYPNTEELLARILSTDWNDLEERRRIAVVAVRYFSRDSYADTYLSLFR